MENACAVVMRNGNIITHTFSFTSYMYFTRESWNVGRLIAIYNPIFSIFLITFQGKKAQGWYGDMYISPLVEIIIMSCAKVCEYSNYQIYMTTILVFWASLLLITIYCSFKDIFWKGTSAKIKRSNAVVTPFA